MKIIFDFLFNDVQRLVGGQFLTGLKKMFDA